jgi:hypothetical protein
MTKDHSEAEQFLATIKEPLQIMVMGLISRHNTVPPAAMLPALAAAMGAIMSEASMTADIATTVRIRGELQKCFEEMLKKHASALRGVNLSAKAS